MKKKRGIAAVGAILAVVLLALMVGTSEILPLDEEGNVILAKEEGEENYLDTHWDAIIEETTANAVDFQELLESTADLADAQEGLYTVSGTAVVAEVNTESQAGYLVIEPENYSGDYQFQIQIGPVFRGTAWRDSLSCISFSDFDNQMEWSGLSSDMMERIAGEQFAEYDMNTLAGKTVSFIGVFSLEGEEVLQIQAIEFAVK